jgi:nucleoside-diphosphate-sugar epimerase
MKYERALVTGGAGFIGSHLVDNLLRRGMKVISIDNMLTGNKKNLNDARLYPNFTERIMDVREVEASDLKGIDIIFHQAASKKTICLNDPLKDLAINAAGTLKLMLKAKEAGVKKIIHASTGSVYGELGQPVQDEKHSTKPVSYYGISKLAGESYIRLIYPDAVIMRYFHVYGPRQDGGEKGGVVSIFATRMIQGEPPVINGDGLQERSFTYVDDVVNANVFFMENDHSGIYNVASGDHINLLTLVDDLNSILGTDLKPEFIPPTVGDIKYFNVSNKKLTDLGFEFHTFFKEGLRKTVKHIYGEFR